MVTRVSVQVRVLGSIEVTRDGQAIRLAGQGQRAVLGALALEPGRPVSVERLAEAIWQFSPPATSRTKIQAHVCALRRSLDQPARGGCGPLLTAGSGYALCRECVQLDLAEFDRLTAKGRRALAAGGRAWPLSCSPTRSPCGGGPPSRMPSRPPSGRPPARWRNAAC
jgi:DNA-binding SARP family transcriptional activator